MLKIAISGSFRKHFSEIIKLIYKSEEAGIDVLSPKKSKIINPGAEFIFLESDDTEDQMMLQLRHLEAISQSDALYVCNHDGYMGASTILEMGWALALGKPVYSKEGVDDSTLKFFVKTRSIPPLSTVKQRFHWDANEVVASLSVFEWWFANKLQIY